MAHRIAFLPTKPDDTALYIERLVSFEWVPGIAISQGRKSVANLHAAAIEQLGITEILEISTRSPTHLGILLSAFNLEIEVNSQKVSVEVAYQSSKVFENGGPYLDLLNVSSLKAKQDLRLKNSGKVTGFRFEGVEWPLKGNPNFYDYLYIRGLLDYEKSADLAKFQMFTDIAYSQNKLQQSMKKAFNCQARTAAIFSTLQKRMPDKVILEHVKTSALKLDSEPEQLDLF